MINFEIIEGPDHNVLASYKYFQNQIYLGRNSGDLWINDGDLFTSHIMLEVLGAELLIHPQKGVEFYLINKKRASNIRKLKIHDQITIGKTVLRIIAFEESVRLNKKTLLDQKLQRLIDEDSPRLPVIERLTQLMK